MISLKEFRSKASATADKSPYACYVDDGMMLCKDGTLLKSYFYRAKDVASSTPAERNYQTHRFNVAFTHFDNHFAIYQDAVRFPSSEYPAEHRSYFPDPISRLIEAENRLKFITEGNHFETYYVLTIGYTPPFNRESKIAGLMYDTEKAEKQSLGDKHIAHFKKVLEDFEDSLAGVVELRRMGSYTHTDRFGKKHLRDELVNYLHFAFTSLSHPVNIPPIPMYADEYIGGQELSVGDMPAIGDNYICCVSLEGFPSESYPNMLEILEHLPVAYRWSNRMIMLDRHESASRLKSRRRKFKQGERGFWAQTFKTSGGIVNEDAVLMTKQMEAAINDSNSGLVAFGYYTSVIVLMGPDRKELYENARLILREVQREGFTSRIETINTLEAWLGTLPGNHYANVRRNLIHTQNLADLLPLSSVYSGAEVCPCPYYPAQSPPLLYGDTSGATPFRLHLHVGDVGHTMIFGPTGSGKSTSLATMIAQFLRYPNASIFVFDKGNSLWALVNACGGRHYDIGSDQTPCFAPLSVLDTDSDMMWAEEWVATCYQLQTGNSPTPKQRQAIHDAMRLLREAGSPEHRSLHDFTTTVQDESLRDALNYYTVKGALGHLLDSEHDGLQNSDFTVLEIEELMALGDKAAIPVLLYLFRRFEKSLHGQPALLVLDEAWVMLGHPVFREKIREWLKVLRKANCSVVMATQSLSDAVKSGIFDVLVESCPTKILLPNEEANKAGTEHHPGPKDLYTTMGLNEAEIHILETATKKRHYYYVSPNGRRLFDLGLGPIALSFVAVSDKDTLAHLKKLKAEKGDQWPYEWLRERGIDYEPLMA